MNSIPHNASAHDDHHDRRGTVQLGFWIYLMSDCLLLGARFAPFAILSGAYAGDPTGAKLFDLKYVAAETALLLLSSLTTAWR